VNVGSLFAGIGGFDLGFARAGMHTVWVVERDPFCQFVLAKRFPNAERHRDVQQVSSSNLASVDVLCGGFPCQDVSNANPRARGVIDGTRSGLWGHFARLIRELRPSYVVIENSPILSSKGLDVVLCDLAEVGYDAEWNIVSAASVGAPHIRERLWIVAYPHRVGQPGPWGEHGLFHAPKWEAWKSKALCCDWWAKQPEPSRVADGFPYRMDKDWRWRVATTGNTVVPAITEYIGSCIMSDHATQYVSKRPAP
jgi:DNA (cytosine-5)-methyltransferase 1